MDWDRIGTDWIGLAMIGKLENIGTGLAWIGMDWHGLARIGTDWHGLARIGKLAEFASERKIYPDWHRIGSGLASIGLELAQDWHRIGMYWLGIGT